MVPPPDRQPQGQLRARGLGGRGLNVLITGVAGFIGSHLAEQLATEHTVVGVDNYETGSPDNYPAIELDIADRHALYAVANAAEPDLVIHCAASYKDPDKWHRDTDTNVTGTINAVLAAAHHGARLVYFQTALPPVSSYAISKIAGQRYIELSGIPALTFRLANVYGPRNLSGPIPTFYKRLRAAEACMVVETRRDMVYLGDLLDCVRLGLEQEASGCYDVCSGEPTTISDLYFAVEQALGVEGEVTFVPPSGDDVPTELDQRNCLPGWSAQTKLQDGILEACRWYDEHGVAETYTHLKLAS